MVCYYCHSETQVTNSRYQKRANRVWRRRRCLQCGNIATTLESLDYASSLSFRGAEGRLEPFLRDKLFMSLYASLQHRQTALRDATSLTDTVLAKLHVCMHDGAIDRLMLITHIIAVLRRFDKASAVHFDAYHKD